MKESFSKIEFQALSPLNLCIKFVVKLKDLMSGENVGQYCISLS